MVHVRITSDYVPCQRVPVLVYFGKTGSDGFTGPASAIGAVFTGCVSSLEDLSKQTVGEMMSLLLKVDRLRELGMYGERWVCVCEGCAWGEGHV